MKFMERTIKSIKEDKKMDKLAKKLKASLEDSAVINSSHDKEVE